MVLYLKARANIEDILIDSIEVRLTSGREVLLTWDESDISRTSFGFLARYKGVYFDEDYANGQMEELNGMQVLDVTLSSESNQYNLFFLEEMEFEDNGKNLSFRFPIVKSELCNFSESISEAEFDFVWSMILSVAIVEDASDNVRENRTKAILELRNYLKHYLERGFPLNVVFPILKRKGHMILCSSTKNEMDLIVKPRCPHFDGSKFIIDEYFVPEEELISWSEASLKAPLGYIGAKRYLEVFQMVFPEKYKEIQKTVHI